jgi:uncharacterized protein (DUF1501 family)
MSTTRRDFLKSALGASAVLSLAPAVPSFLGRTASAADADASQRDTVLVVVQLSGGNDGLNTVVPYGDDVYGQNRTTLRLPTQDLHKIDSLLGFHPEMQATWKLYQEGLLSIVQGVGYPNNDRSHDVAMRDWHTAQPGDASCQTGWIGRTIDSVTGPDSTVTPGIFVGPISAPFALNAERSVVPSVHSLEQCMLRGGVSPTDPPTDGRSSSGLLDYVCRASQAARASSQQVERVLGGADSGSEYPPFQFAGLLKNVAQLIRANTGIRIFFTELGGGGIGGFDNHAGQRDNHAALLRQFSESVGAFAGDLQRDGWLDRVVLMTFSEFGRTLAENGRRGTGHGDAAPMFLVGGGLRGGLVGAHPNLTQLIEGAPKSHTDFRRVYATVLEEWLGFDSQAVLDKKYEPLDVFA